MFEASIRRGFGRVCLLSPARWRDRPFFYRAFQISRQRAQENKWKERARESQPLPSHSPNLDPPQPR